MTNGSLNHGLTGHNSKTPKEIYKRMQVGNILPLNPGHNTN